MESVRDDVYKSFELFFAYKMRAQWKGQIQIKG